jgi:hypothetical protein
MVDAPTVVGALRGISQNGAVRRVSLLVPGTGVMLDREPNNPHDSNAVRVLNEDSKMLGHLDATSAAVVAMHMDKGVIFIASVMTAPILKRLPINGNSYLGIKKDSVLIRCVPLPPLLKKVTAHGEVHA